ncbi:MAG: PEP-CTERM sorting domain-containing protein [Alphaproteobacteria bacterium]|nr:PEP-CTERM sorting domain-containing protein [Alphaproteobacteria bacterium]
MHKHLFLATFAGAAALMTISPSAMAQGPIAVSEPGTLGIAALGIGFAVYLARRNRK